ncbi:MAG: hypothetical protein CML03_08610 [Pseudooceanicola sp.]|nr:hypothetical protein [Pseudooceanicola sp.]
MFDQQILHPTRARDDRAIASARGDLVRKQDQRRAAPFGDQIAEPAGEFWGASEITSLAPLSVDYAPAPAGGS